MRVLKKQENQGIVGIFTITVIDGITGKIKSRKEIKNKVVLVGRQTLANQFMPSPETACAFTNIAIGSGETAWNDTQTTLIAETTRVGLVSTGSGEGSATCAAVFPAGTATGTHKEIGVFLNGSLTANSGVLWSRILYNVTVGAPDPLYIDYRLTLLNS